MSGCAGCKRQAGPSDRFSVRRAEVWTQRYHYTNIAPVLPCCSARASTDLSVPLIFLLVVKRINLTDLHRYKYLYGAFTGGSGSKESAFNVGEPGSHPELGRSPGEGHGNPLQYSCLENPMDRRIWWATVHEFSELGMTE